MSGNSTELDVVASAFSVTVCQCIDFVCVTATVVERDTPLVLCVSPVEEGASNTTTSPVNITNFNLTLSAPDIAFDVVTFGTDGPVYEPRYTDVDYDDGSDTVQIKSIFFARFEHYGFTSATAGGKAYLEFKTKGAQMTQELPILAEYSIEVEFELFVSENIPQFGSVITGYNVGTCQCINFVCVTGIPSPIAMSQPLVLCIFPLYEGELATNVTITNFSLKLSALDISYDPITIGSNAPVLDSQSQVDYDDGSETVQITVLVHEMFFLDGYYPSVNATGVVYVYKGDVYHSAWRVSIVVALEPLAPQEGCFHRLIDKLIHILN